VDDSNLTEKTSNQTTSENSVMKKKTIKIVLTEVKSNGWTLKHESELKNIKKLSNSLDLFNLPVKLKNMTKTLSRKFFNK
jgi:hypothetical protein